VIKGGARYVIWHVMGEAVANAIDAMAAIKKMVFEDESLAMDDLLAALAADWGGYENLRRRFVARAPKFANDNDYADDIGREMMAYFVDRTRYHAARHPHVIFPCSVGTFSWYAMIGTEVAATPDGRHSGEPVAANLSPAVGTDMSGPTSAINSYVKMHVGDLAAGAPIDLRFSANGLEGDAGTGRLAGLVRAFIDLGGNMLTVTVTDVEDLKRAMEEPEKYRHLRVRMGGWSAYFVTLGEELQRLHIRRVEHGLV
jgi:formate C-acetyltransferase